MITGTIKLSLIICITLSSALTYAGNTIVGCTQDCRKVITWTGCGISKKGYMKELADVYGKKNHITFDLSGGGATKGIRDVVANKVQMGGTCRLPLLNTVNENRDHYEEDDSLLIPVAWDPLVVIVNEKNPINNISSNDLKKILSGEITRWDEIAGNTKNSGSFDLYIRPGKISGVGRTLRQILFNNKNKAFTNSASILASSGIIEKTVEKNKNAIAVTGYSSARKRWGLKVLRLDNIENSITSLKKGDYPMYRILFLTLLKESLADKDIYQFVRFIRSPQAAVIIRKAGTVPFNDAIALTHKLEYAYLDDLFYLDIHHRYNPSNNALKSWSKHKAEMVSKLSN